MKPTKKKAAKKKPARKPKGDPTQAALGAIEQVIGDKLKKPRKS